MAGLALLSCLLSPRENTASSAVNLVWDISYGIRRPLP
jgi:hypothetical protein